jgi:hypothetical protein
MAKSNSKKKSVPTYEASYVSHDALRLGSSKKNLHNFDPVDVYEVPVDESLVMPSDLAEEVGVFDDELKTAIVSPLFAHCLDNPGELLDGPVYSNRRSVTTGTLYTCDLKNLGMSNRPTKQDFFVDVKGVGIPQRYSKYVDARQVHNFIERHNLTEKLRGKDIENMPVFSLNEYLTYGTPEGSQDVDIGKISLYGFAHFNEMGFKLAVPLCTVKYPEEIQRLAAEFEVVDPARVVLGQEKRLLPSHIRGTYFEFNPGRNPEIARMISEDEGVLRRLSAKIPQDAVKYIELPAQSTWRRMNGFIWDYIGYVESILLDPERQTKKNNSWYLAKDWVLAGSGMYFVDLESMTLDRKVFDEEDLADEHHLYLTTILKDTLRVSTLYDLAVADVGDVRKQRKIERNARERFIAEINKSKHLEAEETENQYRITLNYNDESIRPTEYRIPKNEIPEVVQ